MAEIANLTKSNPAPKMGVVGRSQGFLHISEPLLKPGALIGMSPARRPWRSQYQNWKVSRQVERVRKKKTDERINERDSW